MLTWNDVAACFSTVLGRKVRAVSTPGAVFATAARLLHRRAEVAERTMALNAFMASSESVFEPGDGLVDPATMTTVEQFLQQKAGLPEALPVVV